jgi:hypothetical protein
MRVNINCITLAEDIARASAGMNLDVAPIDYPDLVFSLLARVCAGTVG